MSACARVGNPTGGDKDETPPVLIKSIPSDAQVNYKNKEIILYFDEYVTFKDLQKNIMISPPPTSFPSISPTGIASKVFKIKFKDSLNPNTTYIINFGESIQDYNEGNKLKHLRLVFSTGTDIDSLQLKGKVNFAHFDKKPENVIVGLYKKKDYYDSIVFREKPFYITPVDKNGQFSFTHLKEGVYVPIAIADETGDYKYQSKKEAIGFIDKAIAIPRDSIFSISIFKEKQPTNIKQIIQVSANHIKIGYKGNAKEIVIEPEQVVNTSLVTGKQAIHFWYRSKRDSIKLVVKTPKREKEYRRKRIHKKDTLLSLNISNTRKHNPLDIVLIKANIPLQKYDSLKIELLQDSLSVPYKLVPTKNHAFTLIFDKQFGTKYQLKLLPGAIIDFLNHKNKDTIVRSIDIPKKNTYGNLIVDVKNQDQLPVYIELLNEQNKLVKKSKTQTSSNFMFKYLVPGKYHLRLVLDTNNNNKWDTGNYLQHKQAEKSLEFPSNIEVRANWDINQSLDLSSYQK